MIHTNPCVIQEEVTGLISPSPSSISPLSDPSEAKQVQKGNHWGGEVATSCRSAEDVCVVKPIGVVYCGSFVTSKQDEQ